MLTQLLAKSSVRKAAERLYAAAASQARTPALYARMGTPDTVEGRFELLTLHVILLIGRLKDGPPEAAAVRQTLFDVYVGNLDAALREMGVGDLTVGKRMRKLGEAFYGRALACETAFKALPDTRPLEETLARTVFEASPGAEPGPLADYLKRCRETLAAGDVEALIAGAPGWAAPEVGA
ncbi:MAG TPA: ubiquinol-cytochrome C chaperone family protein [Caulobacteraceae bacterium]|nr:ubiquinol-cytochrome C chaperone family protein [Caulobacteraceae bacterium]